jgi:hypothetical protein
MMEGMSGTGGLLKPARLLLAAAALAGLLAMHGLSFGHDMTPAAASVTHLAVGAGPAGMTHSTGRALAAMREHASGSKAVTGRAALTEATDCATCSMGHAACLATLRDTTHLKAPVPSALPTVAKALLQLPTSAGATPAVERAPPQQSLTRLCISRT